MNSRIKNVLVLSSVLVLIGFVLLFSVSISLSNTFKVYADNCDATAECFNEGTDSNQFNSCARLAICNNLGDHANQNNACADNASCLNRNFVDGSNQNNGCAHTVSCANFGDGSNQNNGCADNVVCTNDGDSSNHNIACGQRASYTCYNIACAGLFCVNNGDLSNQNIACHSGDRGPDFFAGCRSFGSSGSQNLACQSTDLCDNTGINTNVYSNSAFLCNSGAPDTTTLCQPGRTIVIPNH